MTLLEISVAMPVVLVALGILVQMLTAGMGIRTGGQQDWAANSAAQNALERMRNENFSQIFVLFNSDPFDDPNGPGTAPGSTFDVPGLTALGAEPVGEIVFPQVNVGNEIVPVWELREDAVIPELNLPRDLSGDRVIDDQNHAGDYTLLPVLVRVRWQGLSSPRTLSLQTILSETRS